MLFRTLLFAALCAPLPLIAQYPARAITLIVPFSPGTGIDILARICGQKLAERWGVIFTPTIVFLKDDLTGLEGKWGRELEAIERLPLSFSADTFYDLFVWVRLKLYERDRNFQRFHIARIAEREALKLAPDRPGRTN